MSLEIKAPVFPESVADGTVATWHKKPGEAVKRDELIVDIETDKVVMEVVAPADGVISQVMKNEGDTVLSQEVLAIFTAGAAAAPVAAAAPAPVAAAAASAPAAAGPAARKAAAEAREKGQELRKRAKTAEAELERLTNQLKAIDQAMFDPKTATGPLAAMTMTELMKHRAETEERIKGAEAAWIEASEALETIAA